MNVITVKFVLIGIIINFIFTLSLHWLLIKDIANERVYKVINIRKYIKSKNLRFKRRYKENSLLEKGFLLLKVLGNIIFTDILVADFFKMKLGTDKEKRKKYIAKLNHANLILSVFFIVLSFINCEVVCESIVIPFSVIRALSRSYEILIAFTNDIIDKNSKTSALTSSDRLKLAINSFFEIIINYSIVYHLMNFITEINISTLQYENIFVSLMKSIGISTLTNVGDLTLIGTMQLLSSMSLIYFGLAGYIGSNEK